MKKVNENTRYYVICLKCNWSGIMTLAELLDENCCCLNPACQASADFLDQTEIKQEAAKQEVAQCHRES